MYSKIFLDSAPIIYYIEHSDLYFEKVRDFIFSNADNAALFFTSRVTNTEFLTKPLRLSDLETVDDFYTFRKLLNITFFDVTESISIYAARLRAKYEGFKTVDSIQLATAIETGCDVFLTNDKQLKQCEEIRVVLVCEL